MLRPIKSTLSRPRLFAATLAGSAGGVTVTGDGSVTASRLFQGVYQVNLRSPFYDKAVASSLQDESDFDNTAQWTSDELTQTSGQGDPDGGTSATKFVPSTNSARHQIYQPAAKRPSFTAGDIVKFRVRLKNIDNAQKIWVGTAPSGYHGCVIDTAGAVVGLSQCAATSTSLSGGWYLVEMIYVIPTTTTYTFGFGFTNTTTASSGAASYAGDGSTGFLAYKAEVFAISNLGAGIATSANSGYVSIATPMINTGCLVLNYNNTTLTDGTVYLVGACSDSPHPEIISPAQNVLTSFSKPRLIAFQWSDAGALTKGLTSGTLTKGTTGVYTITFKNTFGVIPQVAATATTSGYRAAVTSLSRTSATVTVTNASRAATDAGAILWVVGTDGIEPGDGMSRNLLYSDQLRPYLGILNTSKSAATFTTKAGASQFTLANGGTGIISATYKSYAMGPLGLLRAPTIVAGTNDALLHGGAAVTTITSTTACAITTTNSGGSATDGSCSALVLGHNFSTEI